MKRKKSKKDGLCNEEVTSVILVDTDYQADGETAGTIPFAQPGWYIYAPQAATTKVGFNILLFFYIATDTRISHFKS